MGKIAIVYHSGYGHTAKVAEHVLKGMQSVDGVSADLYKAEDLGDPDQGPWDELAAADAIVYGAPTYMGSASAVMKQFMDASSKVWFTDGWRDKLAAGFTNSGSLHGDKQSTLQQFFTLAMQHGMLWVGLGMKSQFNSSEHQYDGAQNRAGYSAGLATQSLIDKGADETPNDGDLTTAEAFGERIAKATLRLRG